MTFSEINIAMKNRALLFLLFAITGIFSCKPPRTFECLPPPPPQVYGETTVKVGATITLNVTAGTPGNWSTGNTAIATVNGIGVVTGVSEGTATITYTSYNSCGGYYYSQHSVTVTNNAMAVGQRYGGGIIAYILQPGDAGYDATVTHGLIAAPTDQADAPWTDGLTTGPTNATGTAIGTGWANTNAIMLKYGITGDFAVIRCRHLTLEGNSDWYLPSKDELAKLYDNRAVIGGFTTGMYWASTEFDDNQAWFRNFSTGDWGSQDKTTVYKVRAIRSF